jgi:hypothetical protein
LVLVLALVLILVFIFASPRFLFLVDALIVIFLYSFFLLFNFTPFLTFVEDFWFIKFPVKVEFSGDSTKIVSAPSVVVSATEFGLGVGVDFVVVFLIACSLLVDKIRV